MELRHGDMRKHRGLQQLHGYGQGQAQSQVGLLVLAHNGLTLLKARDDRKAAAATAAAATAAPAQRRRAVPTLQVDQEWAGWN